MEALQGAGVAAGAARGLTEVLLYEPHLMARGYWQEMERPHMDFVQQPSPAFREEGRSYPIRLAAPTLGQSSREVLSRILGLERQPSSTAWRPPPSSAKRRSRSASAARAAQR